LIGDRKRIFWGPQGTDLAGEFDPVWDDRLLG
jgi:hypothetical protein